MQDPAQSSTRLPKAYRFGAFEADLVTRELRKNGRRIRLQDQPFRVLALLLQNYPNMVGREELRKELWGDDTFVEFDHGLSNAISRIRDALGDSADSGRFIETLPKRGYRFLVAVEAVMPDAAPPATAKSSNSGPGLEPAMAPLPQSHPAAQETPPQFPARAAAANSTSWRGPRAAVAVAVLAALGLVLAARAVFQPPPPTLLQYKQLTSFGDEVFAPAISRDGRMIAFIRGSDLEFPGTGEIYAKLLPNGDPVQLTHDGLMKYGVEFSPDGTQITYTELDPQRTWETESVSPLGGAKRELLPNAAGLTWLDDHHVIFGETKSGIHLGLVTSTDGRADQRDIYLPAHERGMAHYGWASPDHRWVLVAEMGPTGEWLRCRLVPFDGSSAGGQVGPEKACVSAAWSPDGRWMYFNAGIEGSRHIWREPFPKGKIDQITSGPTDESGIAVSSDGRSMVTSIGVRESGVWISDAQGERLISSQGYASQPSFSRDGREVYFLSRQNSPDANNELWSVDIASGKSEPLVQGFSIISYAVSADGNKIVFWARPAGAASQIWLAMRDHASSPRMLTSAGEDSPFLGANGEIIFRAEEGGQNFLYRMKEDGSGRTKVMAQAIENLRGGSPDKKLVVVMAPASGLPPVAMEAVAVDSGEARKICPAACTVQWSPDGARLYVQPMEGGGKTVMMPVPRGSSLPKLPAEGIHSPDDAASVPGAAVIDMPHIFESHCDCVAAPGLTIGTFAYARTVVHRNLFEIPLQ